MLQTDVWLNLINCFCMFNSPIGRNVVLERNYGAPEIVNDGVTIARDVILEDPEMNVGAKLIIEVASKSDNKAGDGTTTSTLMTQEIVNQVIANQSQSEFYFCNIF